MQNAWGFLHPAFTTLGSICLLQVRFLRQFVNLYPEELKEISTNVPYPDNTLLMHAIRHHIFVSIFILTIYETHYIIMSRILDIYICMISNRTWITFKTKSSTSIWQYPQNTLFWLFPSIEGILKVIYLPFCNWVLYWQLAFKSCQIIETLVLHEDPFPFHPSQSLIDLLHSIVIIIIIYCDVPGSPCLSKSRSNMRSVSFFIFFCRYQVTSLK